MEGRLLKHERARIRKDLKKPCEFCPQVFDKLGALSIHYKVVHDDKDSSAIKDPGMLMYINLHKRLPEELVICEVCAKEVKKTHYRSHISTRHGKGGPRMKKCEYCGDMIKANSYNSHKNKHLKDTRHYLCAECGTSFNNPEVSCREN